MPLIFTGKEGEVFNARICTSARDATTEIDTIPQQSRGNGIRKKIYSTLCIPDDKREGPFYLDLEFTGPPNREPSYDYLCSIWSLVGGPGEHNGAVPRRFSEDVAGVLAQDRLTWSFSTEGLRVPIPDADGKLRAVYRVNIFRYERGTLKITPSTNDSPVQYGGQLVDTINLDDARREKPYFSLFFEYRGLEVVVPPLPVLSPRHRRQKRDTRPPKRLRLTMTPKNDATHAPQAGPSQSRYRSPTVIHLRDQDELSKNYVEVARSAMQRNAESKAILSKRERELEEKLARVNQETEELNRSSLQCADAVAMLDVDM